MRCAPRAGNDPALKQAAEEPVAWIGANGKVVAKSVGFRSKAELAAMVEDAK